MSDYESPLINVKECANILGCRIGQVYVNIRKNVYPAGVIVFLGEKSIRFNHPKLMAWIEAGGCQHGKLKPDPIKAAERFKAAALFGEVSAIRTQ